MQTIRDGFGVLRTADPSELSELLSSLLPFEKQDEGIEVRTGTGRRMRPGIQVVRKREVAEAAQQSPQIKLPSVYVALQEKVPGLNRPMGLSLTRAHLVRARNGDEYIVLEPGTDGAQRLVEERRRIAAALGSIASSFRGFNPEHAPPDMTVAYAEKGALRRDTNDMLSIAASSLPLTVELGPATFRPSAQQLTQEQRW